MTEKVTVEEVVQPPNWVIYVTYCLDYIDYRCHSVISVLDRSHIECDLNFEFKVTSLHSIFSGICGCKLYPRNT